MYDLRVTVVEIRGFCDLPMKVGDYFEVAGGRVYLPPSGYICMWALASLLPMLPAKQRNIVEENDWIPTTRQMSCPDPNGRVIFQIEQLEGSAPLAKGVEASEFPLPGEADQSPDEGAPPPRMLVRQGACDACGLCADACAMGGQPRIFPRSPGEDPGVCRQCGNAPCVRACPVDALHRDPRTRAVLLDDARCTGCMACVQACPFNAVGWHPRENAPLICDLCEGDPRCVPVCPRDVIAMGRASEA